MFVYICSNCSLMFIHVYLCCVLHVVLFSIFKEWIWTCSSSKRTNINTDICIIKYSCSFNVIRTDANMSSFVFIWLVYRSADGQVKVAPGKGSRTSSHLLETVDSLRRSDRFWALESGALFLITQNIGSSNVPQ